MSDKLVISMTLVVYVVLMLFIGFLAYRKNKATSDYFLGGRSLGPWTAALSAGASDMSGWLLLGLPGIAFLGGGEALWMSAGLLFGSWINWLLIARRLRCYSIRVNAMTFGEYFSRRFTDHSRMLQVVSAVVILFFFLIYTSSALVAGGKLFASTFGMGYEISVVIAVLSVVSYTYFGGFLAVCWTDLVQGLLMLAALLIVPMVVIEVAGGLPDVIQTANTSYANFLNPFSTGAGSAVKLSAIIGSLAWGLGYLGQPHILVRFLAVRSPADVTTARRISFFWSLLCLAGALLSGLTGRIYVDHVSGITLPDPEQIFVVLIHVLFNPVVAGILLAAVLAAIMSTADSQLLVCSSAFAEDIYKDQFRHSAGNVEITRVGRLSVIFVALLSGMIALDPQNSVLSLVAYAWAGLGAAFGPALLLSLYWSRMTGLGALAGIISGGSSVVIFQMFSTEGLGNYALLPGFILSTLSVVLVSLGCPRPEKRQLADFKYVDSAVNNDNATDIQQEKIHRSCAQPDA